MTTSNVVNLADRRPTPHVCPPCSLRAVHVALANLLAGEEILLDRRDVEAVHEHATAAVAALDQKARP